MDTVTRRRFLAASGVVGAGALLDGAATITWRTLMDSRKNSPAVPSGEGVLVVVTLYGGNDGLNTVVPYADSAYHDQRKELAYDPADVLKLDDDLGFNPGMTGMADLFKQGRVAVARGVAYADPKYSHFTSMDIWQTASPTAPTNTGWIGRYLDATGDDPLRAVAMGATLPVMAVGSKATASALPVGNYEPLDPTMGRCMAAMGKTDRSDSAAAAEVAQSFAAERVVAGTFDSLLAGKSGSTTTTTGKKRSTGDNRLAVELDAVSRAVKAGVPTKVWMVSLGGFDFHADERDRQQALWKDIDTAVSGFFKAIEGSAHADGLVMMIHSEFGRRVQANASQGTDHGSAAPVFVIGKPVVGGFHGEEPSLTDLDAGNLKVSTDFRAIYGELLGSVLQTDPARVLDQVPRSMGLIRT